MLYRKVKDQVKGKEDRLTQLQYDWQYGDLYRDNQDMRYVNFRYGDHIDRIGDRRGNEMEEIIPEAMKAKQEWRWWRYGSSTWMQRLFNPNL